MSGGRTYIILNLDGREYYCDATLPEYRDIRDEIPYLATSTWKTHFWSSLKIHKGPNRLMLSIVCMPLRTEYMLAQTSRQSYAYRKKDIRVSVVGEEGVIYEELKLIGCYVTEGDCLEFHPDRVIRL